MKLFKAFAYIAAACLLLPFQVKAAGPGWEISRFESDIRILQDGRAEITEKIDVDFKSLEKHGIFRDIPYSYRLPDGNTLYTKIEVQKVLQDGESIPYDSGQNSGVVRLKIGDADKTINGPHSYSLSYIATGILKGFEGYDELYWNVTGNEWEVPIGSAFARVSLPGGQILQSSCYRGGSGSTATCQGAAQGSVYEASTGALAIGEGMTVAAGFTKGLVPLLAVTASEAGEVSPLDSVSWPLVVALALLSTAAGLTLLFRRWWTGGRDGWMAPLGSQEENTSGKPVPFAYNDTVVPEYQAPEQLRPAEIGVLLDEKADMVDLTSTIVDLAARGYLTITEVPKKGMFGSVDYTFVRTEKLATDLQEYETLILNGIFSGESKEASLSDLKNTFYTNLPGIRDSLYKGVIGKKLFPSNPQSVRNNFYLLGALMAGLSIPLLILGLATGWVLALGLAPAMMICGLAVLVTARSMPRRTAWGRELYRRAKGYRLFLSSTEKFRQPFLEKEGVFGELLPYAMVFGVTKKLAQAFKGMDIPVSSPGWYVGTGHFNPVLFGASMDSFSRSLGSAMASAPSSSGSGGGGFSGGGFGGGGGGSW
ncbi:MAG: hypothetical protein K0S20_681 [Patescibacteria group bacterium]|jgi:uncharacterized membrane protein YgcG|nr:hypothetical protein [Patescibacteria group bacterium]